jgi:hypothetical protein
VSRASSRSGNTKLEQHCEIRNQDVLLGRGKCNFKHVGNMAYRVLIDKRLEKYSSSDSRSEKTHMVVQVVESVSEAGGRFLKQEGEDCWFPVDKKTAREKVGHSFRDAIKAKTSNAVRVEENVHSSITLKSSFGEILTWLERRNFAPTENQRVLTMTFSEVKKTSYKPVEMPHSAAKVSPVSAAAHLETISKQAAKTYMAMSHDEKVEIARQVASSISEKCISTEPLLSWSTKSGPIKKRISSATSSSFETPYHSNSN